MNIAFPDSCLVQFAKAPRPGTVKTRLRSALGDEGCLALHCALVRQVFDTQKRGHIAHQELWWSEPHTFFEELLGDTTVVARNQHGADLGERMAFAFADRLQHYAKVVLIGSDCPAIDPDYIRSAFLALDEVPAVLGPAEDGGYVLIGLTVAAPVLFSGIPWGSEQVLTRTRERLGGMGWQWRELDILPDIDRPEDLQHLMGHPKLHFFYKKRLSL